MSLKPNQIVLQAGRVSTKNDIDQTVMSKEDQMAELNEQAALLHSNLTEFDRLLKETARQYESIQSLGVMHGAFFMASHTVFGSHYYDTKEKS
ncbi:hypothetical protein ACI3LY_000898 [Candidozyma auris]|nr:hypothetical protein CAJCM15448_09870 [[Candida] auris]